MSLPVKSYKDYPSSMPLLRLMARIVKLRNQLFKYANVFNKAERKKKSGF